MLHSKVVITTYLGKWESPYECKGSISTYLVWSTDAKECMTWGSAACMRRHRGIDSIASVRLLERPNLKFWTSTFSNDWNIEKYFIIICVFSFSVDEFLFTTLTYVARCQAVGKSHRDHSGSCYVYRDIKFKFQLYQCICCSKYSSK